MSHPTAHRRSILRQALEALEPRQLLHGDVNVTFQFQPEGTPLVAGTIADYGYAYGDRGNGYTYGWDVDNRANMRDRNKTSDQSHDTLAQMQVGGNFKWILQVPNGQYSVTIVSGDSKYFDGDDQIKVEGQRVMYGVPSAKKRYLRATQVITVSDGQLDVRPETTGVNTKIISLNLQSVHDAEAAPTISVVADPSANQATEGGADGAFIFSRTSEGLDDALTVTLVWSGSAGKKDIASRPTTITFDAGVSTVSVPVVAIDDDLDEAPETAKVAIQSAPSSYQVGTPTAQVTVIGAEPVVPQPASVTIAAVDGEATEGGGTGLIRLTRSGDASAQLVVAITWSGSANNSDVNRPATITFAAGSSTADLVVTAIDDSVDETDETATATLTPPATDANYTLGSATSASVIIHDNDDTPPSTTFTNITWHTTTAPPISFSETTSMVLGGKLYLFGGFNGVFSPQSNVYRFDGTTWTTMRNTPVAFTHVGATEVDGKMWIAGGYLGNGNGGQIFGTTDVRIYDPSTDTWTTGPSLPSGRAAGNLVKVGRKLYFFGGETQNRAADSTTTWALDLDNQSAGWVTKASMPMSRNHTASLEINGKIYAFGGQTGYDDNLVAHNDIQIYDPTSNSWTVSTKKLPGNRSHTANAVQYYEGKILILGGESAHNVPANNVWSIDPSTLVTTALGNFPDSRLSIATGIINGKLYAIGGYKGSIATTAYVGTFI